MMIYTAIILTIGIFIGWNFPQPRWAKNFQGKIAGLFKD